MNNLKNIVIVVLLIIVGVMLLVFLPNNQNQKDDITANVTDFHTCAEAGFPVAESFPRQCNTPDGRNFVEDISEDAEVVLETPVRGALVTSPLVVKGKAKGNWFFEANLPVTLKDSNGKVLAQVGAMTADEWMTTDYASFSTTLTFATPETEFGVLVIAKDNPSGDPQNDAEFAIPIRFRY